LNLRSSSYAAGSENLSSRTSSVSNKGKRMKRDDLESQSHSSKKRAGPLQDVTNNLARQNGASMMVFNQKANNNGRVTRSMTSSARKNKSLANGCETVSKVESKSKLEQSATTCSASTTRKISQSFAQASINEANAIFPGLHQVSDSNADSQSNVVGQQMVGSQALQRPVHCSRRLWKDIDAPMRNDMRMCTEYVNDVYQNAQIKQKKHVPNPDYMELHQREITVTMRGILIDWLVEVAMEYNQSQETLFLSVGYIDAYLSKSRCIRSKLQLVGITCMHIASKYQEIYPPPLTDFCYITDNTYEREELIAMERKVLDVLDFELSVPTTWMFLMRFLRVAEADRTTEYFGMYLAELSLLEYGLLQFLPSQIAASAVMLALYNNDKPHWSNTLEHYTGYTPRALRDCVQLLHSSSVRNGAAASGPASAGQNQQHRNDTLPAIGEKYGKEESRRVSSRTLREISLALFDQPY